jgi:hypothetical protein
MNIDIARGWLADRAKWEIPRSTEMAEWISGEGPIGDEKLLFTYSRNTSNTVLWMYFAAGFVAPS